MEKRNINDLKKNEKNPKKIDWFRLEQLKKSLSEFPEMLQIRPIVINKDNVIIGGNLRWQAARELGWNEVPVMIIDNEEKEKEFLIKDNLSFGEWNWEGLKEDFKSNKLIEWGLDVPLFFRDEDIDMGVKDDEEIQKDIKLDSKKELPKSTKKALYLFFTAENKAIFVESLKKDKGERTFEEVVLEKIRLYLDGNN